MEGLNHFFVEGMKLAAAAGKHLVVAAGFQRSLSGIAEGLPMPTKRVFRNVPQANPAYLRARPKETPIHHFLRKADAFENLRAAIAAHCGNAHFGHNLQNAAFNRAAIVDDGLLCLQVVQFAIFRPAPDGVDGFIRMHRRSAKTDQTGKLMHVASLARLADQGGPQPPARSNQMMMHGAHRQKHWNRRPIRTGLPVAQNQNCLSLAHGFGGLTANPFQCDLQSACAFF